MRRGVCMNSFFISLCFTLNLCYVLLRFGLDNSNIRSDFLGLLFFGFSLTLLLCNLSSYEWVFSLVWKLHIDNLNIGAFSKYIIQLHIYCISNFVTWEFSISPESCWVKITHCFTSYWINIWNISDLVALLELVV